MRLIFMGTPDFAVPALDALVAAGHEIAAVYCQPPRPAGRGKALQHSQVQRRAEALGLEVRTPVTLRDADEQARFAALEADAAVVAAYGLILPKPILAAPRLGCFNIHASLLPSWRGAAPIQRAILAGDAVTGVTIMDMEAGLDTGPMRATVEVEIDRKTAGALTKELAEKGAALMVQVLGDPSAYPSRPQPEDGVTYASKIEKAEARLDFSAGAVAAERQVRAFNPAPGAFFELNGERIRILSAEMDNTAGGPGLVLDDKLLIGCGTDALRPTRVQRAGRGAMSTEELLRGFPIPPGTRLS
ncbi:methionyl-tRNA formyltransferase [Sphingomonas changbaiensis NBRC 104936]|uniref:Methionyl-tRNA formyltransferase n=1 Tax=Sphingomonas changbaiensis NBRC 104936 TaxID=1219043 RepID=A0A0E9ML24_9SPHN|nr:methionyl-tRNA formyltransferase [Sphingomonas changbaiensis]GAO38116.1 methionyl-tRNA formyltransferase [Sphingomonas changbaiensis NBRC 104936]